ncbi:alpha/beta hydrolase [Promicromonospora sp. NPDC050262]|uniref:alpha/beta fold hydrolase n=1 Tax=Promicromonospora sp. NPDC050262 TaxID=3155036 RepID=UPI00340CC0C8
MPLFRLPDGRDLEYEVRGPGSGPVVLFHHGMPGSAVPMDTVLGSMTQSGYQVVTYSRAGYGTSSPNAGRTVADTAADCALLLAHLGVAHHRVVGWSAGGPHALASAAVAPEHVEGVLIVASFAPFDADGLDYVDGMGAQNVAQFATAGQGEPAVREIVGQMAAAVRGNTPADVGTSMASLLPPVDLAVLTAGYGADNAATMDHGLSRSDEGWVADLTALTSPWGFDLDDITAPVELWHGALDQMVPVTHGQWLTAHLPTAVAHLTPGDGHLSLAVGSLGEKLRALSARAPRPLPDVPKGRLADGWT